jgi:hypothetical protein
MQKTYNKNNDLGSLTPMSPKVRSYSWMHFVMNARKERGAPCVKKGLPSTRVTKFSPIIER